MAVDDDVIVDVQNGEEHGEKRKASAEEEDPIRDFSSNNHAAEFHATPAVSA